MEDFFAEIIGKIILIAGRIYLLDQFINFIFPVLFPNIIFSTIAICMAGFIYYSKLKKVEVIVNPEIDSANKILEGSLKDFWES